MRTPSTFMLKLTSLLVAIGGLSLAACSDTPITGPGNLIARSQTDAAARAQPTFTYTSIDVSGASATTPQGIDAGGAVSGSYIAGGAVHGFIFRAGELTTVDYPNADNTELHGIGPSGDVVGDWWNNDEEAVASHGFRRTVDGQFDTVLFPDHLYEIPQRILPDGTILGCRHDHDLMGSMKGIRIARDGASEIETFASMNNGATPNGRLIVGLYRNMDAGNRQEGFIIENGVFSPLLVPGSNLTTAWDVNPRGDIVGVYRTGSSGAFVVRGYVRTEDGFTTISYPGASATRAFGVNARGDIVGTYVLNGVTHGFLATRVD